LPREEVAREGEDPVGFDSEAVASRAEAAFLPVACLLVASLPVRVAPIEIAEEDPAVVASAQQEVDSLSRKRISHVLRLFFPSFR
jgi:hypothetical protein